MAPTVTLKKYISMLLVLRGYFKWCIFVGKFCMNLGLEGVAACFQRSHLQRLRAENTAEFETSFHVANLKVVNWLGG